MDYTLQAHGLTAICTTSGGELISCRGADGVEYVWTGDSQYWSGHAPVLFPVVGAVEGNSIEFDGTQYPMAKHGFARKREFLCSAQTSDSITFSLCADAETRRSFPYDFTLLVTHTLLPNGFSTQYEVQNTGTIPFGACIGGHAGFCCPLRAGEQFEDYALTFAQPVQNAPLFTGNDDLLHAENRMQVPLSADACTLPLCYDLFAQDVIIFDALDARSVTLQNTRTGSGVAFSFYGFSHLGVWTPPGKHAPFLCLEPWKGLPDFAGCTGRMTDKVDSVWFGPRAMNVCGYTVRFL